MDKLYYPLTCDVFVDVTEFAHECLKQIFSLYSKRPEPPQTVVLEGHSMVSTPCPCTHTANTFKSQT